MSAIPEQLEAVNQKIADAAARAGRDAAEVELVAVTKTHPPEAIHEALDAGHTLFGESRVQEARAKIPLLPSRARWLATGVPRGAAASVHGQERRFRGGSGGRCDARACRHRHLRRPHRKDVETRATLLIPSPFDPDQRVKRKSLRH